MEILVQTEWLLQNINDPKLILLDASPEKTAEGKISPLAGKTIKGAIQLDLKKLSQPNAPFPNTVPSPIQFEKTCRELGINSESEIVVFDNLGLYTSPRVWWLFHTMGHKNISILNGGLPAWLQQGGQTVTDYDLPSRTGNFRAKLNPDNIIFYNEVEENIRTHQFKIVDARGKGRFEGTAPEPRPQLKSGHIENSVNIPYNEVINEDGTLKSSSSLQEIFNSVNPKNEELVFSCGSGLTACILMIASQQTSHKSTKVYDGSWTEWAELQGLKNE